MGNGSESLRRWRSALCCLRRKENPRDVCLRSEYSHLVEAAAPQCRELFVIYFIVCLTGRSSTLPDRCPFCNFGLNLFFERLSKKETRFFQCILRPWLSPRPIRRCSCSRDPPWHAHKNGCRSTCRPDAYRSTCRSVPGQNGWARPGASSCSRRARR